MDTICIIPTWHITETFENGVGNELVKQCNFSIWDSEIKSYAEVYGNHASLILKFNNSSIS